MRVGIVVVDSLIPNLALMRRSAWHKAQGDEVRVYEPLRDHEWVEVCEASKQFTYTPDYPYFPDCEIIRGGTGYDLTTLLTPEQDTTYPDYGILGCEYAIGRFTRGCIRKCPWCVVWRQDGNVHQVAELGDFWRGQDRLRLLDDNLTAMPELFVDVCEQLAKERVRVMFESLDIRLMDDAMCAALMRVRRDSCLHFAWDSMREEKRTLDGLRRLKTHYPSLHDVLVYVLIGFDTTPEEDLHRVESLRDLGAMPFVMPFDKTDPYQRRFTRWVNHKAIFKSVPWAEYRDGRVKR